MPRYDVSGRVLGMDGKPCAGADVGLYYAHSEDGVRDRIAGQMKTNAQGRFRFEKAIAWEPVTEDTSNRSFTPYYSVVIGHPGQGIYFMNIWGLLTLYVVQKPISHRSRPLRDSVFAVFSDPAIIMAG
ncbi:MAG: hypothetical protein M1457_12510 [bacterium]|nr:hypothetical protein [bacterium]